MPRRRAILDWLRVDRASGVPLQEQIGQQFLAAIHDGRLSPGTPLPSSRQLAAELAVARGTIAAAYERLLGENAIEVRSRSVTFVAETRAAPIPEIRSLPVTDSLAEGDLVFNPPPYPAFMTGIPAFDSFPATRWARLLSKRSQQMSQELADNDFHMGGYNPLRTEIASHLRTARGITCDPEQVVITSSARAALTTVCHLLTKRGDPCIIEDPGYPLARRIMADLGLQTIPLPVDLDGIEVDEGIPSARIAYVTPTYQMPMGVRLSDRRCRKLIDWAQREDAWVVEDDYDSEFRYSGEAIAALHSADAYGRVIHIGTFAKTLFPSLRVAYLVMPKMLARQASITTYLHGREPALHVQAALFDFIAQGHYASHIHRTRRLYRRRQSLLVDALNKHLDGIVQLAKPSGGMHVILPLPPEIPVKLVQSAAAEQQMHVRPIAFYSVKAPAPNALLLGYSALPDRQIEPAAARLGEIVKACHTGLV